MDFEITHFFDASPAEIATTMLDEDYQRSLSNIGHLRRELLEQKTAENGRVSRRVRCVLDLKVSGAARRFIGDADPAWIEMATWNEEALRWSFTIDPEIAKELLEAKGTIGITGDVAGSVRTIQGNVKVRVPFYGGKVEGWIVEGLSDAYDEEADRLRAWIEG
ncbi:MAG: DUF2505 domain-containing protein [Actinomycetota bacterium]